MKKYNLLVLVFLFFIFYLNASGQYSRKTKMNKSDLAGGNRSAMVIWPHTGTFNIEIAVHYGYNMAGSGVSEIIDKENTYLRGLAGASSSLSSSTYKYLDDFMFFGFKALYFVDDKFGVGLHYFNCNYSQELVFLDATGEGDILNLNYIGSSFTYFIFQKERFGISTKSDLSFVTGSFESVPALNNLAEKGELDPISGLSGIVMAQHTEASLTGYHVSFGFMTNWLFARWFSLDTGLSLSYFSGKLDKPVWIGTPDDFSSFRPAFNMGFSFYLFNKR